MPPQQVQPEPVRDRKRLLLLAAGALVVVVLVVGAVMLFRHSSTDNGSGKAVALSENVAEVAIGTNGYAPATVKVKVGQQVTWTNQTANPVQLSADPSALPGFDTVEPLDQGDSYTYIFDKAGTYRYYDATDPTKFVGVITVE